jgi:hypothetical protein
VSRPINDITIQYRIKEEELEPETNRLYIKALNSIDDLVELNNGEVTTTLCHQTLDDIEVFKQKLSDSLDLFTNVENIVTQYLEHRALASGLSHPTNVVDHVDSQVENIDNENLESPSPYDQQRKIAKDIRRHALSTERSK